MREGKYTRPQSIAIAYSYWNREGQKAQQGTEWYQNNPPMFSTSYGQPMPQVPINQSQEQYNISKGYDPKIGYTNYIQGDANSDGIVNELDNPQNSYTQNSVNIMNPYGGISMDYALNFAGEGFGSGDYGKAAIGTGTTLLKGARNFLSGYSTGKENKRVQGEYMDKMFDRTPNYAYGQQGGKISNADVIAQNAIVDQGVGNVNLEGSEFVMRNTGQIQPVIGDKHIENGKKADGVNAQLNEGDKVLSNYVKLKPADIKDLKERYNISLKSGTTFADAQKKLDQKLGIKKLETEKADILEKLEKATKIKDLDTKQLSLEVLTKKTGDVNEKLNTLAGIRATNFEFLFQKQEAIPKQGDGTQLYDKNGKEVTESKQEVAQQGIHYKTNNQSYDAQKVSNVLNNGFSNDSIGINLKKIKNIQSGVTNDKLGEGYYMYYDKLPTDQGFDVNKNREFITQEAYKNTVMGTPAYQEYMRSIATPTNNSYQVAEFQQGGQIESLANKHGISMERAQELMSYQQGGSIDIPKSHEGIFTEQEETQEGQSSNTQEEQGELSPEQIISSFARLSQQDPQQIIAQLQKMSPEEQNQALSQMMQALQQGQQNPQEEQMEGQYSNEQEEGMEVAQQGGEKEYYQEGRVYSKEDQQSRLNDFYNQVSGLGYEGKKDIGAMQKWMADNYPNEVVKYFTENGQPLTAKHVDIIKNKYKDVFKETGISSNKKSEDYTSEEKLKLQTALGNKADQNFLLEGFKDNKWDWRFPMVAQKPMTSAQSTNKVEITAPNMSRFTLPQENIPTQVTPQTESIAEQKKAETPNGVKNIMPNFGTYIPLFSPMQPIAKETVTFGRAEPVKITPEAMLAEEENKRQSDIAIIEQSGLSPQQKQAALAQGLASSQMASNDAIAKAEQYNAQNQYAVDQYNLGTAAKEDIMNAQFRQNYQDKAMQTLANQEESMRNQYRSNFLQEQANSNKVINMNTANALNNQFAITDQGVIALNNRPYEVKTDYLPQSAIDKMTAEEYNAYKKMMALKAFNTKS